MENASLIFTFLIYLLNTLVSYRLMRKANGVWLFPAILLYLLICGLILFPFSDFIDEQFRKNGFKLNTSHNGAVLMFVIYLICIIITIVTIIIANLKRKSGSTAITVILILLITTVNACTSKKDPNKITGDYSSETFIYDTVVTRHLLKHFKDKSGSGEDVPPLLFGVGHNDDFIVAKQHPTSGYEKGFVVDPSVTNYYLIDINEKFFRMVSNVMGPLTLQQFDSARAVYKIPVIPFDQVYPEHNDAFIDGKIIAR